MRVSTRHRLVSAFTAVALVAGMVSLTGVGTAGACQEQQIKLPGEARGYDVPDEGRTLEGIVTNNTTQTVRPGYVKITWAESDHRARETWVCSGPLAPGQWATFSAEWPCGVPTTWTPVVTGYAEPADASDVALPLAVSDPGSATVDESGVRHYAVTVTNPNTFAVSNIDFNGIERDSATSAFVGVLCGGDVPCELAAGASVQLDVTGSAPWDGAVTADIRITAAEKPVLTMSADTTTPVVGSPVTFTIDLAHGDGSPVTGAQTVKLLAKSGECWREVDSFDTETGSVQAVVTPNRPTSFKAVFEGDGSLGEARSQTVVVTPQTIDGAPVAPGKVKARHAFKVRGRIDGGADSAGKPVTVIAERKSGSHWSKAASLKTKADSQGRYSASIKLSSAGTYRIRAYRAGVGYSHSKSLQVTK